MHMDNSWVCLLTNYDIADITVYTFYTCNYVWAKHEPSLGHLKKLVMFELLLKNFEKALLS